MYIDDLLHALETAAVQIDFSLPRDHSWQSVHVNGDSVATFLATSFRGSQNALRQHQ